ncbi:MAG TPA: MFS transporter [Candidatus Saccharimonadales bacterium]|nr:MFS transporter [Candidatus Saccharimonadales bacterium]
MDKLKGKLEGKALPLVLLTVFLDVLGVGILIPVMPELVYKIFLPAGYSFNTGLVILGWLTAVYPLMQFFATPILGQLSDRFGRKPVLGFSLFGTALGYVVFALAIITKNIPLLFIGRAVDGLTGGNISVARAVIADVSEPEHRARNFGLIGAAFGVGFVMGPYIGARLAVAHASVFGLFHTPGWFNAATPFWFTAILSGLNTLLMFLILPETHQHINSRLKIAWSKSLHNIARAASLPGLRTVFTSEFFFWGGFTFFTTFFQILLIQKLHFTTNNVGDYFAYIGLCIALAQIVIVPFAVKRFKAHQILRVSLIGNGVALFLQLFPHNTTQLLAVSPLIALFNGLTMANASALVSLSAGKKVQGEVLGIEASVQALAQAVPAAISGYIAAMGVNMPVLVGGTIVIAGGLIFNLFYHPSKHVLHEETADMPMGAH